MPLNAQKIKPQRYGSAPLNAWSSPRDAFGLVIIVVAFEIAQMRSSIIGQREGDTAVASSPDQSSR